MEIRVTEKAKKIFSDAPEKFIRVDADPGGCSGWKWTLESTDEIKLSSYYIFNTKEGTGKIVGLFKVLPKIFVKCLFFSLISSFDGFHSLVLSILSATISIDLCN